MGYRIEVISVILRLAVLVQYRLVTDRQTDGRTHDDSIWTNFSLVNFSHARVAW